MPIEPQFAYSPNREAKCGEKKVGARIGREIRNFQMQWKKAMNIAADGCLSPSVVAHVDGFFVSIMRRSVQLEKLEMLKPQC